MNTSNLFIVMPRPLIIKPLESLELVTVIGYFVPYHETFQRQENISKA